MSRRSEWRGLLVSVREAVEVGPALAGGASIIDVKEPLHGPLGAAAPATVTAIAAAVAGRVPWTLACGELAGDAPARLVRTVVAELPAGVPAAAAAKAGPGGLDAVAWRRAFADFMHDLPAGVEPVAVAYGDAERAAAPAVEEVIQGAAELGCRLLLIDTWEKSGPDLLATGGGRLAGWIRRGLRLGLGVAVAGRLDGAGVAAARRLGADVTGVRGSVCRGGRSGLIDADLVAAAAREAPPPRRLSSWLSWTPLQLQESRP